MTAVAATTVLIAAVMLLMLATTCTIAFVHGWQDGPDSHNRDRHEYIPRLFYTAGWRARRWRLAIARRELEQERVIRDAATAAFYAELDAAVKNELRRKDNA